MPKEKLNRSQIPSNFYNPYISNYGCYEKNKEKS